LLADGVLCASLLGQLLGAHLVLAGALLFGQLLCSLQLDLPQTLLLSQLLCPLLLGLLQAPLLG
jgi:hypothetical protein